MSRSKLLTRFVKLYYETGVSKPVTLLSLMQFDEAYLQKYAGRSDAKERYEGLVNYIFEGGK